MYKLVLMHFEILFLFALKAITIHRYNYRIGKKLDESK